MNGCLDDFLTGLGATESVHETWRATTSFLKSLGFDLMMYGYAGTTGISVEVETLSNFPAAYQQRYQTGQYYRNDPVVQHCMGSLAPLRVGRDSLPLWPDRGHHLTRVQRRIVNEAAECGMSVGIVIPLRAPGRHPIAGMSLSNDMRPVEFEHLMAEWGYVAQLAALHAHTRMQIQLQGVERSAGDLSLTGRERECLLWVAQGLSSREIAVKLGVGMKTVDYHIAKAMGELEVATRSHAVARAIAFGLLDV